MSARQVTEGLGQNHKMIRNDKVFNRIMGNFEQKMIAHQGLKVRAGGFWIITPIHPLKRRAVRPQPPFNGGRAGKTWGLKHLDLGPHWEHPMECSQGRPEIKGLRFREGRGRPFEPEPDHAGVGIGTRTPLFPSLFQPSGPQTRGGH